MTLKVCNVRELNRPHMSDGFLADSVDTTLASLYSCTTAAMFRELHDQLASLERHAQLTRCRVRTTSAMSTQRWAIPLSSCVN